MARFGSVLTAMVTPFTPSGELDLDGAANLAKYLIANGNDGIVVAGTTGESPTISFEEQRELMMTVREAIPNASMVAGAGSNDTRSAIKNTEMATEAGADCILAVTPYYNRPSQQGLYEHFKASAEATDKPVMLYDVPGRTSLKLESATIIELAKLPNVVALKDAAGNAPATAELIANVGEGFEVYCGDDSLTLPLLSVGAVGVVGVATHYVGEAMSAMVAAYKKGLVAEAIEINQSMMAAYDHFGYSDAPSPVPTKSIMNLLGVPVGKCRLPMGPEPADMAERSRKVLTAIGKSEA